MSILDATITPPPFICACVPKRTAALAAQNGVNGAASGGGATGHAFADPSGQGGDYGAPGSFGGQGGGAAGYAIRKNGHAVTVTNNGTITGAVG